jgi:hypothetical protein
MSNVGKTIKKVANKVVETVTAPFKSPEPPPAQTAPPPPTIINMPAPEEAARNKRMPTPTDPDILAAGRRSRQAALRRRGRQSTILTDRARDIVGTSSQKLGG